MPGEVELQWPTELTGPLAVQVHELIGLVAGLGGAIGWMRPPPRSQTDDWLAGVLAAVARGDGALCTAWRDGGLVAMGLWQRDPTTYMRHSAELAKVMVHPQARGARLGRLVTQQLMASATEAGLETLTLGARGNNHLAIQLYTELGFVEWGRLPNVIEVGDQRFDDVRMYLELATPAHLNLRGSAPSGPGYTPLRPQR
ncbi:MAG: GNAT family N-acetyltransferase [Actinomycetota bacterium]